MDSMAKAEDIKLNRDPEEYRVGDILRLTEGTLAPVACIDETDSQVRQVFRVSDKTDVE